MNEDSTCPPPSTLRKAQSCTAAESSIGGNVAVTFRVVSPRTSHGGPPMTDPRDFDRRMDMERQAEMERTTGTSTAWGWIAAAVFVIVILALVFAGGENTRTAREDAS